MSDMFDYLTWRGDLPMDLVPFCPVDALVLSALSYVHFDGLVRQDLSAPVTVAQAALAYLALPPEGRGRCRCQEDLELLQALADAPRFAGLELAFRSEQFVPEKELQFGAVAVLLGDGSAALVFRGTDATLVGWKEDFNMSFMEAVPAQLAAQDYLCRFAQVHAGPLLLCGHSKGGNLAVFAGTSCPQPVRDRISAVYTFDSPGFPHPFLSRPEYGQLLPRLHSFLPQSSIVGMLLERKEPYTVVRSAGIGPFQHDPYSWQVLGGDLVRLEQVSASSRLTDRALTSWLSTLSPQQREQVVDTVYDLISSGAEFSSPDPFLPLSLLQPQSLSAMLRSLRELPPEDRRAVTDSLERLIRSAAQALKDSAPDPPAFLKR